MGGEMEEMPGEEMAMEEGPVMGKTYHLIHLCHLTRRQATGFDLELEWVEEERQGPPEGGKVPRKN
jgi:hypothetical protein